MSLDIEKIKIEAKELLDILFNNYHLEEEVFQEHKGPYSWFDENAYNLTKFAKFYNGMTRMVIAPNGENYALKIQYRDFNIDYNAGEERVYKQAVARGLEKCFAETAYVFNYCNHDIYAMELCDANEDENNSRIYDYYYNEFCAENNLDSDDFQSQKEFDEQYDSCDALDSCGVIEYAASVWGTELANKVEDFLDDMNVNDYHSGNIGFIDDWLVICDYAGYCREVGL